MKQRRSSPVASMLLFTIVPYLLFSSCSHAVVASTDRQASTSIRGQQLDESNAIFDRRADTMTAKNDFDAATLSPLGKDSQNYSEEHSASRRRDLIARQKREQLQRRLKKSQKRKRQPKNFALYRYTATGAKAGESPPSSKSAKARQITGSPAAPSQVPSLTPSKSSAPSKSSQPSLSTAPSQVPSTSTAPSLQPTTPPKSEKTSKSGKAPRAAKAK